MVQVFLLQKSKVTKLFQLEMV